MNEPATAAARISEDLDKTRNAVKRRYDRKAKERALLEAATSVFAQHGYDAATTRMVAEQAGCAEALIQRYFGGKRGLLLAVLRKRQDVMRSNLRASVTGGASVSNVVRGILLNRIDYFSSHEDLERLAVSRIVVDREIAESVSRESHDHSITVFQSELKRHQEAGRIRADLDLVGAADAMAALAFYLGFYCQLVWNLDRLTIRRLANVGADVICNGIIEPRSLRQH